MEDKNPKRVAQGKRLAEMDKKFWGGKPGPKVFSDADEFMSYWMERLEKDRTDLDSFIRAYCKAPFFLRCKLVQSDTMKQIWDAMVADVALGAVKLPREQWTALSKIVDMRRAEKVQELMNDRKRINKENAKHDKAGKEIMTGFVVGTEDE